MAISSQGVETKQQPIATLGRYKMANNTSQATESAEKAAGCGCARTGNRNGCPCNKRICLPIMGLVGIALVGFLVVKAMKSSRS